MSDVHSGLKTYIVPEYKIKEDIIEVGKCLEKNNVEYDEESLYTIIKIK